MVNDILETYFLTEFKNNQGTRFICKDNRGSVSLLLDLPIGQIPSA